MMRRRVLGSSGMLVSELTLGAMTFGAETPEDETHAILDAFVAAGGDTIRLCRRLRGRSQRGDRRALDGRSRQP